MRRVFSIMVLVPFCAVALWAVDNTKVLDAATQTVQSMTTGANQFHHRCYTPRRASLLSPN